MKNLNLKNRSLALLIVGVLGLSSSKLQAQDVPGKISFGFDAGGNKYYGNYTDDQFAFQGMAFIRWNIMDWLSLHAAYNGGELKYKATTGSIANELPPFESDQYERRHRPVAWSDNEPHVSADGISCCQPMYSLLKRSCPISSED